MKSKYFIINKETSLESLHKQYKALVLTHHADKLAGKENISQGDIREKEIIMSEINVEYTGLLKQFKSTGNREKKIYQYLRTGQDELAHMISLLPQEVKAASHKKMEKYLLEKWDARVKSTVPSSLRNVVDYLIREKLAQLDVEASLANFDLEEFLERFRTVGKE